MPVQETVDARRRAARGRPAGRRGHRQHGAAPPLLPATRPDRGRRTGRSTAPRSPPGSRAAGLRRGRRRTVDRAARRGAPSTPQRVGLEKRERARARRRSAGRRTSCRCCPTASTSAACTSWPTQLRRAGRVRLTAAGSAATPATLDVDALLDDPATRIVVCCGSGGVGKTTTAAALALRAAERGPAVVVLTIDPARRLAQSHGPRPSWTTPRARSPGIDAGRGRRAARDDAGHEADVRRGRRGARRPGAGRRRSSPTPSTSRCRRASPARRSTWRWRSSASCAAGPTEPWDLIVVDTPPSRSALDFLDAPQAARLVPRRPADPAARWPRPGPAAGPTCGCVSAGRRRVHRRARPRSSARSC